MPTWPSAITVISVATITPSDTYLRDTDQCHAYTAEQTTYCDREPFMMYSGSPLARLAPAHGGVRMRLNTRPA
jgi:hypothetical protein